MRTLPFTRELVASQSGCTSPRVAHLEMAGLDLNPDLPHPQSTLIPSMSGCSCVWPYAGDVGVTF